MIISVSRRTDIPAFFTDWFMKRIDEQYCTMVNPFNRNQVSYISLKPQDVEAMVFWTKNARPLMPHLEKLKQLGYSYYFQYTVNGYGEILEPNVPSLDECIETFCELSSMVGPEKVIWRYDPIIISNKTGIDYHKERFSYILERLCQATRRIVISIVDDYRKATINFKRLQQSGIEVSLIKDAAEVGGLVHYIADASASHNLEVFSCAETFDLQPYGIKAGKCIDDELIKELFDIRVGSNKDKSQRAECGCIVSKDIGHYDTCLHGCSYCYAGTLNSGKANQAEHQESSPSMLGRYLAEPKPEKPQKTKTNKKRNAPTVKLDSLF